MTELSDNEFLFTSESVTEGHPDKIADQISDGVLDAVLRDDPYGRVACETLVNTGLIVVSGEISTDTYVDIQEIARETVRKIGYDDAAYGFDCDTCAVINAIDKQSPDIAQGVDAAYETRHDPADEDELDVAGAGDQGMMFGYASNETEELMPLPISLAHKLAKRLSEVRKGEVLPYLRPDGKTQVTVRYQDGRPVEIEKILISTQHADGIDTDSLIKPDLLEHVLRPVLPAELYDEKKLVRNFLVNPTGRFVIGGPMGDCGLTGRKIIVDTYGGMARHGGGAFSGKDPSKVDRSAAYAARWVAKNIVAAGLADRAEVQVAYAIGVAHPVSVMVETFGTEKEERTRGQIARAVDRGLRPAPRGLPRGAQAAPSDLPEDGRLRPLRARRPRLHVGAHRQVAGAARRRRSLIGPCRGAARGRWPLTGAVSRVRAMPSIAQVEPMTTARALRGPFDYRLPEELQGATSASARCSSSRSGAARCWGSSWAWPSRARSPRRSCWRRCARSSWGSRWSSSRWPNGSPRSTARRSPARSRSCCRPAPRAG